MTDYEKEKWIELYRTALLELEHAKVAGRIGDARTEITARLEKLRTLPGLHAAERQTIEDALSGLRVLEREEARHEADERRIAEAALEKLRVIGPSQGQAASHRAGLEQRLAAVRRRMDQGYQDKQDGKIPIGMGLVQVGPCLGSCI